jgi:glycosyltransferase involved in cell wall biosynthesis
MSNVSVIIVSKNNGDALEICLSSLLGCGKLPNDIEVIVVDAMSNDNTPEILRRYRDKIKVIYDSGESLPKARNIGLKNSIGDVIIHLDADYVLTLSTIRRCQKEIENGLDAIIAKEGILKGMGFWREVRSWENMLRSYYGKIEQPHGAHDFQGYPYPRVFRREILEKVGGHNERISFYGEDAELYWRLLQAKARIRYVPDVIMHKIEENSLREIWTKAYRYGLQTQELCRYNKRNILAVIGPFLMVPFPIIPLFMAIAGAFYSKSIKISIALFMCNWLRMLATAAGISRNLFDSIVFPRRSLNKRSFESRK